MSLSHPPKKTATFDHGTFHVNLQKVPFFKSFEVEESTPGGEEPRGIVSHPLILRGAPVTLPKNLTAGTPKVMKVWLEDDFPDFISGWFSLVFGCVIVGEKHISFISWITENKTTSSCCFYVANQLWTHCKLTSLKICRKGRVGWLLYLKGRVSKYTGNLNVHPSRSFLKHWKTSTTCQVVL